MDEKDQKGEGKACCGTKSCCGKGAAAVALLLAVGAGGFFAGRHCKTCAPQAAPAASAPAAPAQK